MEVGVDIIWQYFDDLSATQRKQFMALQVQYAEWNSKINVISRKDIDSLYLRHVLHSLAIAAVFQFRPGMQVLDLGTGGGFPAIPLAILFPEVHFHAVDSIGKKLKVVDGVAGAIGLRNVQTIHSRVEEITRQKFDVVVSRAVAPLKDLLYWTRTLLWPARDVLARFQDDQDGVEVPRGLICLKGGDLGQEISESGKRPLVWEIQQLFQDPFFEHKYILQVL